MTTHDQTNDFFFIVFSVFGNFHSRLKITLICNAASSYILELVAKCFGFCNDANLLKKAKHPNKKNIFFKKGTQSTYKTKKI